MPSSAVADRPRPPSEVVALCLAVGIALLVLAAAFPSIELAAFGASATVEEPPEDDNDRFVQAHEFADLDPESQALVERIIEEDGSVTVYAPRGAQYHEDGALPPVFAGSWLDSYRIGAYVRYEGTWYRVALSVPGAPLHYPLVMGVGAFSGLAVLAAGGAAWKRERDDLALVGAGIGLAVLLWVLWMANVTGYVWPVQ